MAATARAAASAAFGERDEAREAAAAAAARLEQHEKRAANADAELVRYKQTAERAVRQKGSGLIIDDSPHFPHVYRHP